MMQHMARNALIQNVRIEDLKVQCNVRFCYLLAWHYWYATLNYLPVVGS